MFECRSCGERIYWAKTVAGKSMPLNVEKSSRGNIRIVDSLAAVLTVEELEAARAAGEKLWVCHFATCTSAKKHRKERSHG